MPDLQIETMVSSRDFWNLVVTSRLVQRVILENASLLESELVVYSTYHTQCTTKWSYCVKRKCCDLAIFIIIAELWQGESPSAYISAIYRILTVIKKKE